MRLRFMRKISTFKSYKMKKMTDIQNAEKTLKKELSLKCNAKREKR